MDQKPVTPIDYFNHNLQAEQAGVAVDWRRVASTLAQAATANPHAEQAMGEAEAAEEDSQPEHGTH